MFQPFFTRILKEDLGKDVPAYIDKLIYQLNLMTDFLRTAFAKSITIQDNLINPIRTIQLTSTGTPATDTTSFSVTLPAGYQPKGVSILNCIDTSGSLVGAAVTCEMLPGLQNGNVVIRAFYGLTSGHTYSITLLVF